MSTQYTDTLLNEARQQGDTIADALAAKIIMSEPASESGRLGYNRLIDLADILETDSELLLIDKSHLATALAKYPDAERNWYDPIPAPKWVDADQLKLAGTLWEKNSLAMIGVLYAASLPACYLIKDGIPALFQTGKLAKGRYIYQRIYETGIMLEAVMQPGGLQVVNDLIHDEDQLMQAALQAIDKDGDWVVEEQHECKDGKKRHALVRRAGEPTKAAIPTAIATATPAAIPNAIPTAIVDTAIHQERLDTAVQPRAYIWGRGYIQAKKVRLLHASMRFMLQFPEEVAKVRPPSAEEAAAATAGCPMHQNKKWPSAEKGVPVNQEDLAYTLLTFGYSIPKGLVDWGCPLSLPEREAFLHLWRLVGHIMGLREDLLTDKWDKAEELYAAVLKRQGGKSDAGIALTRAVMDFLADYLPSFLGLKKYIPIVLIADLLPANVADLLGDADTKRLRSLYGRALRFVIHKFVRIYYRYYSGVLGASPLSSRLFGDLFARASDALVSSWRDDFRRKPFYIPTDATTWELRRGSDDTFRADLQKWRKRVLAGIAWPMTLMFLSGVTLLISLFTGFKHRHEIIATLTSEHSHSWWWFGGSIALLVAAIWRMDLTLPKICAARPEQDGVATRPGQ